MRILALCLEWPSMTPVLEKLFGGGQAPNTGQHTPVRHISANETATVSPGDVFCEMRGADPTPKSEKIARTFDFIGRRNETMRAQLDSIEYSFRDVEAIRTQFYDALASVAETLEEIERRKVAQLEAERKLEKLTAAHERLKMDKAELRVERDALAVVQGELSARVA